MAATLSLASNRSFAALAGAQFMDAFNDHLFKMVVSLFGVGVLADENGGSYLSLTGILIALPYLLFSGWAGRLADTLPKRSVMMGCKVAELAITLGAVALLAHGHNIAGLLIIFFLLESHSAFFSPSKYGSVPEIVTPRQLVRANGILESSRYAAIVLGSMAGGLLMQFWRTTPVHIGWATVAIAAFGLWCCTSIAPVAPAKPAGSRRSNSLVRVFQGVKRISGSRPLIIAVTSITFFDMLGALAMPGLLLLARIKLGIGDAAAGTLGAFAAIGMLIGALLCGHMASRIQSRIAPIACLSIAAALVVAAVAARDYWSLGGLLLLLGFFAGVFVLPFTTSLQKNAGDGERGLVISTANFFDMAGLLSASGLLLILQEAFGLGPRTILVICGAAAIAYAIALLFWSQRLLSPAGSITSHHEVNHARA